MKQFVAVLKKLRLSTLEDILAAIAMVAIMFMMILTASDVTSRYLFNKPITGSLEILEVVMAIVVFFGLARGQRLNINVGMDLLFDRLKGRALHGLRIFDTLLPLLLFAVVTFSSLRIALDALEKKQLTTGILHFPESPFLFALSLGGLLICIRFIIQLSHEVSALIKAKKEELPIAPPRIEPEL